MRENVEFVPFAYRTHTHKLGVVNSGYVIKSNPKNGEQKWIEIGRRSPQLPQMFFPVSNNVTVRPGDVIASRCSMNNYQDIDVSIGYALKLKTKIYFYFVFRFFSLNFIDLLVMMKCVIFI